MINALRISIGDITYENVKIILSDEIEKLGFDPIFEDHTVMFKMGIKWHVCHDWNLKVIHISRNSLRLPHAIPFEKIVIDSNKIYGPGMFANNKTLANCNIDEIWHHRLEKQVAFSCLEGIFITTDYAINNLILQPNYPQKYVHNMTQNPKANYFKKRAESGGVKPCRSKNTH